MKIAFFSSKSYDHGFFVKASRGYPHEITYLEPQLNESTAQLAAGHECICAFANDDLNANVLTQLAMSGVKLIALRSAGYNHVNLEAAESLELTVVRVPAYSPNAVAEHTVGLMLMLNRRLHRAYNRVREGNFALDGLLGFDFVGLTVGIIGTGKIGTVVARIMKGFGCEVLAFDPNPSDECRELGVQFVTLNELCHMSDIITLHCPLMAETCYIIDEAAINEMKDGVMLINTSRGGLVDTRAAIEGLKSGKLGYFGIDVYEEEGDLFFADRNEEILTDDVFARLLTFPNVVVTGHQAFFTENALTEIANTTLYNVDQFSRGTPTNVVAVQSATVGK
ncbi:MAG: 2-hydroxyacid dehydrogenase [Planctomycetota bacterium]